MLPSIIILLYTQYHYVLLHFVENYTHTFPTATVICGYHLS